MKTGLHIGCSGYYYPSWKKTFYPEGLQPKNWLHYYASVFNSIELNGTFYKIPKLSDLQRYVTLTPDDFTFSVKMNRYMTHILKLKDCSQQVADFTATIQEGLGNKLACILFQMPPSFVYNEENLQRILDNVPRGKSHVIEFRHLSWWNPIVSDALTKAKITFCNIDFPGLDSNIVTTTSLFYFRFHGNPELFKSAYSLKTLRAYAKQIRENGDQQYIYFNNTFYDAAYTNAKQLRDMIG
jgi:uncharacterized protein YecE (DUF72 family)